MKTKNKDLKLTDQLLESHPHSQRETALRKNLHENSTKIEEQESQIRQLEQQLEESKSDHQQPEQPE